MKKPIYSFLIWLAFPLLSFAQFPDPASTRYVSTTGINTDPVSATSWATSTTNLQGAINSLSATGGQVWVAAGTYYPTSDASGNTNPGDLHTKTFVLIDQVALYGGFPATGNPTMAQRNWTANPTILSGDIDQNNTLDANNVTTVVNCPPTVTNTTRFDGFTITGSYGASAFYVQGNPIIANCTIRDNQDIGGGGGGMTVLFASLQLIDSQFLNNRSTSAGGGLYSYGSSFTAVNCRFAGNESADYGGGISNQFSSLTLVNCSFSGNQAQYGGGLDCYLSPFILLTNCTFSANKTIGDGNGGGIYQSASNLMLQNCIVWGNEAAQVSPEIANPGNFTFTNCLVKGFNPGGTNLDGTNPANDPLFVSQPAPGVTTLGDLRLKACSPAINAGSPSTTTAVVGQVDLAGQPRIFGGQIDLGAYEVQTPPGSLSVSLSAPNGTTISCSNAALPLNANVTGGSNYTYTFAGTGQAAQPTSNSTTFVSETGTYTATVQSSEGCVASSTIAVSGSTTLVLASSLATVNLAASGPASCNSPARLIATAPGNSFVFTGPNGYVFSNVYRNIGIYQAFAEGIKIAGTYQLNVYSGACLSATGSITIGGDTNCSQ